MITAMNNFWVVLVLRDMKLLKVWPQCKACLEFYMLISLRTIEYLAACLSKGVHSSLKGKST